MSFFCTVSILALGYILGAHRFLATAGIMGWLTAAIGFLAFAVCARPGAETEERARRGLPILLTGTLGMFATYQLMGVWLRPRSDVALWLLLSGVTVLYLAFRTKGLTLHVCRTQILPLLLLGFLIVGVKTIRDEPDPHIDLFLSQQAAAQALTRFQNPYTATIPDIYGLASPLYIPMFKDGRSIFGSFYPPLIALVELPSFLLTGDVRYTHLIALLISSCLIALMRKSWLSLCGGALLLINPFSLLLIQFAWTEAIAILFFCATLFSVSRYPRAVPYLFGLFLTTKQPVLATLPLVPLLIGETRNWKQMIGFMSKSLAVVTIVCLPFFLWNRGAFVLSLLTVQTVGPLRKDLISYPAYAASIGWFTAPFWLPFLSLPITLYLALWKAPRNPVGFAAASALLLIPFFALSKQGSPNYYFLEVGMLCCAVAMTASDSVQALEITHQRDQTANVSPR